MKHLYQMCRAGKSFLAAFLAVGCLVACNDDDDVTLTPLAPPAVTECAATVHTLTFEWNAVENASQYVWELADPIGTVVAGDVTVSTRAYIEGLQPNTTYTLTVCAYPAVGSGVNEASEVVVLKGTTVAITKLDAPQCTVTVDGETATIIWEAVEHAVSYEYAYLNGNKEVTGSVTECSLVLKSLAEGDYHLSLTAVPDKDDEAHQSSVPVMVTFHVDEVTNWVLYADNVLAHDEYGYFPDFYMQLYKDADAPRYCFKGMFDGYDLVFGVQDVAGKKYKYIYPEGGSYGVDAYYGEPAWFFDEAEGNDSFPLSCIPLDGASLDWGSFAVGVDYTAINFSSRKGWLYGTFYSNAAGDWIYPYLKLSWTAADEAGMSINDLVGTYDETASGYDWYIWDWGTADNSFSYNDGEVVIEKVDDTTVSLSGFYGTSESLTGTVDLKAGTITFAAGQTFALYYTFAAETGVNVPVVATFDEKGTITVDGWGAWYNGYTYVDTAHTVLTKKN